MIFMGRKVIVCNLKKSFFPVIPYYMDKNKILNRARGVRANYKPALISSAASFMIILILLDPVTYVQSALTGLILFGTKVAPALFPFFFFTGILTRLGAAESVGKIMRRPLAALYNVPGCGGYVWGMSILSGYPVGAKLVRELYDGGEIDSRQAVAITSFTSTSGPLFIVGTVAASMFNCARMGYILLAIHFAAALINGFFYRGRKGEGISTRVKPIRMRISSALSESMKSAITSSLTVGGFVVIFGMAADALYNTGIISALATPLSRIMPGGSLTLAEGTLIGLVEVTRGAAYMAQAGADMQAVLPCLSFILAFGGFSIILQSLSFISSCKVSAKKFLSMKCSQSVTAALIATLVALLS